MSDDILDSEDYVLSIVKNCQECKKIRFGFKTTVKLSLSEDVSDRVTSFFSCVKGKTIQLVLDNYCINWNYYSLV